jgi:hypothetical protein
MPEAFLEVQGYAIDRRSFVAAAVTGAIASILPTLVRGAPYDPRRDPLGVRLRYFAGVNQMGRCRRSEVESLLEWNERGEIMVAHPAATMGSPSDSLCQRIHRALAGCPPECGNEGSKGIGLLRHRIRMRSHSISSYGIVEHLAGDVGKFWRYHEIKVRQHEEEQRTSRPRATRMAAVSDHGHPFAASQLSTSSAQKPARTVTCGGKMNSRQLSAQQRKITPAEER